MRVRPAVAGAVLLGAALRLYPVWFALPYAQARPDETTAMGLAAAVLAGDPNPHFFNWPSLTIYVFAGLFSVASRVKGTLTPDDYFLIARTGIALAGTATILVTYQLARRAADARTAVLASFFLAVAVLHVRDSHFATVDILMTLLVTACLASGLESMEAPSVSSYALTGLLAGLAISAKYSAAPVALIVFFLRPGEWPRRRDLFAFTVALGGGFLAGTPFSVLDLHEFMRDIRFERSHLVQGHGPADLGRGWSYHLTRTLPYGLGAPLFAAAIAGVLPFVRHYRRAALPLGVFALVFYAAIGAGHTVFFRYPLPLIPLACLSAAVFVRHAGGWIAQRLRLSPLALTAALAAGVAVPAFARSVRLDRMLARPDARQLASDWLVPRLQADQTLYDSMEIIGLALGRANVHAWRYDTDSASFVNAGGRVPDWLVLYKSPLLEESRATAGLQALAREKYTLVQRFPGTGDASDAMFDRQDAFFLPLDRFDQVAAPGPDVLIYRARGER